MHWFAPARNIRASCSYTFELYVCRTRSYTSNKLLVYLNLITWKKLNCNYCLFSIKKKTKLNCICRWNCIRFQLKYIIYVWRSVIWVPIYYINIYIVYIQSCRVAKTKYKYLTSYGIEALITGQLNVYI